MNRQCANCPRAHNGVNGRFCRQLNRYVEHFATAICNNINPQIQPAL